MDHINVLIVEDLEIESSRMESVLKEHYFNVVAVVKTHKEAIDIFLKENVDILILDIFLNGHPDGLNIAETIDAMPNRMKPFIFVTSSTDRQIFERAKLTHPFAYIVKPWNELELIYAIEQAIEQFYEQQEALSVEEENAVIGDEYLFIKKGKSLKKVHTSEIVYIEVEEKYCNIITEKEKFVILISLVKILELLDSTKFYRTHRNFIVNTEKIVEITPGDNLILLEGSHKATLSDTYKSMIKKIRTLR
jgi:DNA-binding LytR/AlgR family response regulator